jgi:MFS family permease
VGRLPDLPPYDGGERPKGAVLRQIGDGIRLVMDRQVLLLVYVADFAALSLGLPTALFPQLAAETFRPSDIGVLYAAVSAGGVLAGLFSGAFTRVGRHGVAVGVSVGVWGAAVAGFGLSGTLVPAVAWLVLAGGALLALGVFRKTVLQTAVPDGMRGRLQGIDTVVAVGGPRVGNLLHGTVGAALGVPWTVTGGGVLTVAAALLLLVLFPGFRRAGGRGEARRGPRRPPHRSRRGGPHGDDVARLAAAPRDPGAARRLPVGRAGALRRSAGTARPPRRTPR